VAPPRADPQDLVVVVLEPGPWASSGASPWPTTGGVLVETGWDAPARLLAALRAAWTVHHRRWVLAVRRARMALGPPSSHLRQRSLVECHLRAPFAAVATVLGPGVRTDRLHVVGPLRPIGADPSEGVRAPARLQVSWSWPDLPVWVSVRPWSSTRSVLGIELRSHRRPRYPRRYFGLGHRALNGLRAVLPEDDGRST